MATIAALVQGRDNNFNLLRMMAAGSVLISHAYPLSMGSGAAEPLSSIAPTNLGRLAVAIFFAISGFFITKSFDRRHSLIGFMTDRVLRLFPALAIVLILTVLLLGPAFTNLDLKTYFHTRATWGYVPYNLLLFRLRYSLPGVFTDQPAGSAINGSLWTLEFEVTCYAAVVVVGLAGLLATGRFRFFLLVFALAYVDRRVVLGEPISAFFELSLPFVIGMAFYVYRERLTLHWALLLTLLIAAIAARGTPFYRETFIVMLAYATFCFGYVPWGWLKSYNRLGDYSYGMYIYGFPVEQMLIALQRGIRPGALIVEALPVTLCFAVLSWELIERPALSHRHMIGRKLAGRFGPRVSKTGG